MESEAVKESVVRGHVFKAVWTTLIGGSDKKLGDAVKGDWKFQLIVTKQEANIVIIIIMIVKTL